MQEIIVRLESMTPSIKQGGKALFYELIGRLKKILPVTEMLNEKDREIAKLKNILQELVNVDSMSSSKKLEIFAGGQIVSRVDYAIAVSHSLKLQSLIRGTDSASVYQIVLDDAAVCVARNFSKFLQVYEMYCDLVRIQLDLADSFMLLKLLTNLDMLSASKVCKAYPHESKCRLRCGVSALGSSATAKVQRRSSINPGSVTRKG